MAAEKNLSILNRCSIITDVLPICLHDLSTEPARAYDKSIRVGVHAKGSVFCRRRMGSRGTA